MNRAAHLIAAGCVTLALALPASAYAADRTSTQQLVLSSRIIARYGSDEFDGRMRLLVTPDGIISGTYEAEDGERSRVTGGVDAANKLWLEITGLRGYHWVGTLNNGTIDATALRRKDDWHLVTTPAK